MLSNCQNNHILVNRNGIDYYVVKDLEKVHAEMLRLLLIIDKIAHENDISYWVDGGSLIGVLRHKGFIPWDDDLDISMLKKDYLKLIKALSQYCQSHDDVSLFYDEPLVEHTCNYFASKKVFSRTQGSCVLVPVKIDIRPVNCIVNTEDSLKDNSIYRDIANYILFGKSYGHIKEPIDNLDIKQFFHFYNYEYGIESPESTNVVMVHPYYEFSNTFALKCGDLFPIKFLPFDNISVPVPNNYHLLLTKLYGDYMNLPELTNRAPVACEVYLENMSKKRYNMCLSLFKKNKSGLFSRICLVIKQIILIGFWNYINIKLHE